NQWLLLTWLFVNKCCVFVLSFKVTCDSQRDPLVYYWDVYWEQKITLNETVSYWCMSGYKSTDGAIRATCTRYGWRPNPLCQAIANHCSPPPKVDNAVVVSSYQKEYLSGSKVTYHCRYNYTLEGEKLTKCAESSWGQGEKDPCINMCLENSVHVL
uniref:Sushi domain-containing protein n=1 Tax=Lates calcarifer TaxID=8187 RepID=A0A4W6F8K2_LATCA